MKFEKLNYSSGNVKKAFVIGIVVTLLFIVIINLFFTRAKYKLVESRKLASGTINYTLVDFELVEIKFKANGSENYVDVDTIEDNYVLNEEDSYCTEKYTNENNSFEDIRNDNLKINFDKDTKTISVSPYSKKGTKCHLYFDESLPSLCEEGDTTCETLLGNVTINPSCPELDENGDGTIAEVKSANAMICKAKDDFGTSYYYRGTVDNNWVVFGKDKTGSNYIWWRIIRINGNGTIRLIYAGTSTSPKSAPETTGNTTMIKPRTEINTTDQYRMAVRFNEQYNDNKYVGYMYGGTKGQASTGYDAAHKPETKSTVLEEIEYWYNNSTNLGDLAEQYIDVETGFCGDRGVDTTSVSGYTGQGYGTQQTAYAPWTRLYNGSWKGTQTPTLKCGKDTTAQKRDLYTGPSAKGTKSSSGTLIEGNNKLSVPVGLITSDEVVFAGGFGGASNNGYWLYTNRYYWTMSPSYYYYYRSSNQYAYVFVVNTIGALGAGSVNNDDYGVRPVINLKANVKITGTGVDGDPYVVVTA